MTGDSPREGERARFASILLLAALTVFWGGNWPAMKLALREVDPWTFRTFCLLVGGAGLLTIVRAGGQPLTIAPSERGPLCLVALFNITAWHILSAYGLTRIGAGRAAIIAYTMPLWTIVCGRLILGERLTRSKLAALALGLAGLAILIAPEARALWVAPAGTLFVLAAAIAWALGTVLTKAFRWTMPTAVLTGWQLVLGGVPVTVGAALLGRGWSVGPLSAWALGGTAYATFVGVIFCHSVWFELVRVLPSTVAAIGLLGIPVVGVFASALVLGEPVGRAELLALALVVSGLGVLFGGPAISTRAVAAPGRPSGRASWGRGG